MTTAFADVITEEEYAAAIAYGGDIADQAEELISPYAMFRARPDLPELFDQQTSFINCNARVSVCLGGNRSGKTRCAAQKVAKIVREQAPPRARVPFWVIGETYDLSCGVCWVEKLSTLIPPSMIDSIDWYKSRRKWPYAVMLKHPTIPREVGWVLEFKSFEQGRERMQAASIGGAWFNEQPPLELVVEVQARTVDYGAQTIIDFTPLKPTLDWPEKFKNPPPGWKFYRLNSELNAFLGQGNVKQFLDSIPSNHRETRRTGLFASFEGLIFKDWDHGQHVIPPFEIPADAFRGRGIDFGYACPFVCVWWARLASQVKLADGRIAREGTWILYREHVKPQTLLADHARAINSVEPWNAAQRNYGPTIADHDAQDAAELRSHGLNTSPADKGDGSVAAGIFEMQRLMLGGTEQYTPSLLVFETCKEFIREVGAYRYEAGTENRNSREVPVKKDDHVIDASRYILREGIRRFSGAGEVGGMLNPNPSANDWRVKAKGWLGT